MDKESSAAHLQHNRRRRQRREPQTAPASTAILPNPYKDQPRLRGYQSGVSSTQKFADKGISRHGYSTNPDARETGNNIQPKNESTCDPLKKVSVAHHKISRHGEKDVKKKESRLPDSTTYEVKMDDFPELTGILAGQAGSHVQKHCWAPLSPTCLDENSEPAWKLNRKALHFEPSKTDINSGSSEITFAQDNSPSSVTSSWANIASQPPKKPVPKETFTAQADELAPPDEEATIGKKKRKKKKKKVKSTDAHIDPESEKNEFYSELPKFEDEDEFPGLTTSFTGTEKLWTRSNTANLCNPENHNQSIQQLQAVQKKDNTPSAKAPFTDSVKSQKAEKGSGKKSKVPVQLDIGNMLAVLERKQSQKAKQDSKPLTLSVGGGLPVVPKQQPIQKKPWLQDKIAHNPLDSTSPLVKKGKQREVPKAKKPTALKKVILKEREERKQRRLLEERGLLPETESIPAEESAEEENCETTAADEMPHPTNEPGDQPEINGTTNKEREEDAEVTIDQTTSTITTPTTTSSTNQYKIHSRKFRDYCTQILSKDVDECVTALLKELVRFQDRLYQKDPMKARMKRRIVMGLREVLKHLKLKKVKCVIISPNCERIQSKGGLDEALHTIIDTCREQGVPFVFALSRKALGRCVNKAVPVSLVGIFNFDGAQDIYHKMIELSSEAREAYEAMLLSLEQVETAADEEQPFETDQIQLVSGPSSAQPQEPEYIQLWKNLLEKESNHLFVNFEEQLSSMHLDNEYTEHSDGDAMS